MTLGFGEIVRIFMNNLDRPVNITNGPKGITGIDPVSVGGFSLSQTHSFFGFSFPSVYMYYYLFVLCALLVIWICTRLQHSRIGRAWAAIREDEIAAKAMGINTRNVKLLAFAMGASFGGLSGAMFAVRSRASCRRNRSRSGNRSWCWRAWCWAAWATFRA